MAFKIAGMNSKSFKSACGIFFLLFVSINLISSLDLQVLASGSQHSSAGTIKKEIKKPPSTVQHNSVRIVAGPPATCPCSQDNSGTPGICYDYVNGGPDCSSRNCGFPYVCVASSSVTCDLREVASKITSNGDGTCSTMGIWPAIQIYVPQWSYRICMARLLKHDFNTVSISKFVSISKYAVQFLYLNMLGLMVTPLKFFLQRKG